MYALLDSQSNMNFISKELADTIDCMKANDEVSLTTMTSTSKALKCEKVHDLTVKGYNSDVIISLPEAYTREKIPANYNQIPKAELVAKWPHLKDVSQQMSWDKDIPVGLLIGYHSQHPTFCPRETIEGNLGDPYAVRYDLGWVVMGNLQGSASEKNVRTLNTISDDNQQVTFACTAETNKQINKIIDILSQDFKDQAKKQTGTISARQGIHKTNGK